MKPKDLNDGMNTELISKVKFTPKPEAMEWEAQVDVKNGGKKMGPIVPHWAASFVTDHKSKNVGMFHANLVYEKDINLATKIDYSLKDSKMNYCGGILAWKNQEWGQLWLRSNCMSNFHGIGW